MPPSRTHHLLRGWALATAALWGGAFSHLVAGGHLPGIAALLVCWALSGLACVALSALLGRCSAPRVFTALGTLASQALLHAVLAASGLGITVSAVGAAGQGTAPGSPALAHHGLAHHGLAHHGLAHHTAAAGTSMSGMAMPGMPGTGGVHAMGSGQLPGSSLPMLLLHLGTALLTYLLWRRGEQALARLVQVLGLAAGLWHGLWARPAAVLPRAGRPLRPATRPRLLRGRIPVLSLPVRGPPAALFF